MAIDDLEVGGGHYNTTRISDENNLKIVEFRNALHSIRCDELTDEQLDAYIALLETGRSESYGERLKRKEKGEWNGR